MFRLALWLLSQYNAPISERALQAAQRLAYLTLNETDPRRPMTTALSPQGEWSQGESYETILRNVRGEPRVESGYIPGPDDLAALHAAGAPHEVHGVLRMFQTGTNGPEISRRLGKSGMQVQHEMNIGLEEQEEAGHAGVLVYNDRIVSCPKCGSAMSKTGSAFRCPVDTHTIWGSTTNASGKY